MAERVTLGYSVLFTPAAERCLIDRFHNEMKVYCSIFPDAPTPYGLVKGDLLLERENQSPPGSLQMLFYLEKPEPENFLGNISKIEDSFVEQDERGAYSIFKEGAHLGSVELQPLPGGETYCVSLKKTFLGEENEITDLKELVELAIS
jgi:hypothetical protein